MGLKKAQTSIFDIGFMIFFILSASIFFSIYILDFNYGSDFEYFESYSLNALVNVDFFRVLVFNEDISQETLTQDWSEVSTFLGIDEKYLFLRIGNNTIQKKIFTCIPSNSLDFTGGFIIENSTSKFRYVELGVCK